MKRTGKIHDTLACRAAAAGQQGHIRSALQQRFELQKKLAGRQRHCEGGRLTFTSPVDPNMAAAEVTDRSEPRETRVLI